jgi:methylmalonyl-CoA mutase
MSSALAELRPAEARAERLRVVTAASLFDGHDAAINIMRRLLQAQGAEVIHLGHDRSVEEIVAAAVQEDAHAVAVSSYQGGHLEFFRYLIDRLRGVGAGPVRVYGGGGGTITAGEAAELHAYGVARIFRPEDGRELGLEGMIRWLMDDCAGHPRPDAEGALARLGVGDPLAVARLISRLEDEPASPASERLRRELDARRARPRAPVVGFTGTGGSGKSSVIDEIVCRFRLEHPERSIGLLLVDPSRRRSGGALLGDRIRMNAIHGHGVFTRSLATRRAHLALSRAVADAVRVLQPPISTWSWWRRRASGRATRR